jgi:Family of unknown function (DUF5675)
MKVTELYHGAPGDSILGILRDGGMKPSNGEICFVKHESRLHNCFGWGADSRRGAAFVIQVRCYIPDDLTLNPDPRPTYPDTWAVKTDKPIRVDVLRLFVRRKLDEPIEIIDGRDRIEAFFARRGFHVFIKRRQSFANGIVGELYANGQFICYTLELAWLWNQKNKSCVPPGRYPAFLRHDHKDKWRIELSGVPGNRQHVQIHIGNYPRDVKGCVLVGTSYAPDTVLHSGQAYQKLKDAYEHAYGPITVEFGGILATPWGDYSGTRSNVA